MTSARPAPECSPSARRWPCSSPATPGSLDEVEHYTRSLAGAETNVATGLARLGHSTGWIGRVGDDPFGRFIHTALSGTGIDTHHVTIDPPAPTGFQLKSHAGGGDPEVVYFRTNSAGSRLAWDPAPGGYIGGARHLHVTGIPLALSASPPATSLSVPSMSPGDHGVTMSFDTNLRPVLWASTREMIEVTHQMVALADIVLPGASEGQVLLGTNDPLEIGQTYLDMGASTVVVKDGGQGATLVTRTRCCTATSSRSRSSTPSAPATVSPPDSSAARSTGCARGAACAAPPRSAPWPPPVPATGTACRTESSSPPSCETTPSAAGAPVGNWRWPDERAPDRRSHCRSPLTASRSNGRQPSPRQSAASPTGSRSAPR